MVRRLISSLKRRWRKPELPATWAGVYPTFEETPPPGAPYTTNAAVDAAEGLLRETQRDPMPREAALDHQVLSLAVRLTNETPVSIIDFGGGVGQSYAALRRMLPAEIGLRYRVVDLEEVIDRGRMIWSGNGEIEFASGLDVGDFTPSIVFAKGFIQYVRDYRSQLREWFSAGAKWVLFEKLSVVNVPKYATMQVNLYGQSLPYWMFNIADLEDTARECGYTIALQRRLERVYDQSRFPPELRMERATSLLFERMA